MGLYDEYVAGHFCAIQLHCHGMGLQLFANSSKVFKCVYDKYDNEG